MYLYRHVLIPSHQQGTQICLPVWQANVPHEASRSLSYRFYRFEKFIGGFSLFGHLNLIDIREKDGLGVTEGDALGVSVTIITFHSHSFFDIKEGVVKRAGHDASLAPNAQVFVDDYSVIEVWLSVAGLSRAHFKAVGFFTMIAD